MERAELIIQQLQQEVEVKYVESTKNLESIVQFIQQYKSVVDDLIKTKSRYTQIVKQYADDTSSLSIPTTFPGISPPTPQFSNSEMQMDSKELSELGDLITEMEDQKEVIQDQMRKLLQGINTSVVGMTDTASQALLFLGQSIEDSSRNGLYGSTTLDPLV